MVTHYYYWIVARDENGRPYLVAGEQTESQTRERALELLGGLDFEIKRYPTRDLATASQFFRGKRLESTHDIHEATRRIGHERTARRRMKYHKGVSVW